MNNNKIDSQYFYSDLVILENPPPPPPPLMGAHETAPATWQGSGLRESDLHPTQWAA